MNSVRTIFAAALAVCLISLASMTTFAAGEGPMVDGTVTEVRPRRRPNDQARSDNEPRHGRNDHGVQTERPGHGQGREEGRQDQNAC